MDSFWYLAFKGTGFKKVFDTERDNQRNYPNELVGRPVPGDWTAPCLKAKLGRKWPDWIGFSVPLISQRAADVLWYEIHRDVQLLPSLEEEGRRYYLMNVVTEIPRNEWSAKDTSLVNQTCVAADVISLHTAEIPSVFGLEGYKGKLFVSDNVAKRSVLARLSGVVFVSPEIAELSLPFLNPPLEHVTSGFVR